MVILSSLVWLAYFKMVVIIRKICPHGKMAALGGKRRRNIVTLKQDMSVLQLGLLFWLTSSCFKQLTQHGYFEGNVSRKMLNAMSY